jgi:hypothetical protein
MADWRNLAAYYRSPDRADHPELQGYTRHEIYKDCMGAGRATWLRGWLGLARWPCWALPHRAG